MSSASRIRCRLVTGTAVVPEEEPSPSAQHILTGWRELLVYSIENPGIWRTQFKLQSASQYLVGEGARLRLNCTATV